MAVFPMTGEQRRGPAGAPQGLSGPITARAPTARPKIRERSRRSVALSPEVPKWGRCRSNQATAIREGPRSLLVYAKPCQCRTHRVDGAEDDYPVTGNGSSLGGSATLLHRARESDLLRGQPEAV